MGKGKGLFRSSERASPFRLPSDETVRTLEEQSQPPCPSGRFSAVTGTHLVQFPRRPSCSSLPPVRTRFCRLVPSSLRRELTVCAFPILSTCLSLWLLTWCLINPWSAHFFFIFKSSSNLLQYCFCFMFWFVGQEACGILVPQSGSEATYPCFGRRSFNH